MAELRVVNHTFFRELSTKRRVPRIARSVAESDVGLFVLSSSAMHYVYILQLENGQHYIGCTKNLKERLTKHKHHGVPTTSRIRPEELLFYAAFKTQKKAYAFEKYLKSSSGCAFRKKRLL